MFKKLATLLAGAALMVGLGAASAFALPTLPSGYNWSNASYWTFTDLTTNVNGNSDFEIKLENAGYESDFGLFTYVGGVLEKYKVFDYTAEAGAEATVSLQYESGVLMISLNGADWTAFNKTFGFYYDVHTGGTSDSTADYSYYSLSSLNTPDSESGVAHILSAFNPTTVKTLIFLDDQLTTLPASSDNDYDDMNIKANDISPVPEPGTMVLLGAGMLGLAIFGKRRMNREA